MVKGRYEDDHNVGADARCPRSIALRPQASTHQRTGTYPRRQWMAPGRPYARGALGPQGFRRAAGRTIRSGLSQPRLRPEQRFAARPGRQRVRAAGQPETVLVHVGLERAARAPVSTRVDVARFRRASPAPPRPLGRLQIRADAILSRPAQCRHRQGPGAMAVRARVQILPGRQAADARSRGHVVSRRGARSGARSGQARLHCDGRRVRRRDSRAIARDADGPRRARAGIDRRLLQPSNPVAA